jgi:hypothetical protein
LAFSPGIGGAIQIHFAADTVLTFFTDTLSMWHDGDTSLLKDPMRITIFASATAPPVLDTAPLITITPQTRNIPFGSIAADSTLARTFSIRNSSNTHLTLTGSFSSPSAPFSLDSASSSFSLDSAKSQTFGVKFSPTDSGTFRDTITITSNSDSAHKLLKIALSGSAYRVNDTLPAITVLTRQLTFPTDTVGNTVSLKFSIVNSSDTTRPLNCVILSCKKPFSTSLTSDTLSLTEHDSTVVTVTFAPDTSGTFLDSLVVLSNTNTPTSHIRVLLFGRAVPKAITGAVKFSSRASEELKVYPNPSSDIIHLNGGARTIENLELMDISGRAMSTPKIIPSTDVLLNVKNYPAGAYLVRARVGDAVITQHIDIVR